MEVLSSEQPKRQALVNASQYKDYVFSIIKKRTLQVKRIYKSIGIRLIIGLQMNEITTITSST